MNLVWIFCLHHQHVTILHYCANRSSLKHGSRPRKDMFHCRSWLGHFWSRRWRQIRDWRLHCHWRNHHVSFPTIWAPSDAPSFLSISAVSPPPDAIVFVRGQRSRKLTSKTSKPQLWLHNPKRQLTSCLAVTQWSCSIIKLNRLLPPSPRLYQPHLQHHRLSFTIFRIPFKSGVIHASSPCSHEHVHFQTNISRPVLLSARIFHISISVNRCKNIILLSWGVLRYFGVGVFSKHTRGLLAFQFYLNPGREKKSMIASVGISGLLR